MCSFDFKVHNNFSPLVFFITCSFFFRMSCPRCCALLCPSVRRKEILRKGFMIYLLDEFVHEFISLVEHHIAYVKVRMSIEILWIFYLTSLLFWIRIRFCFRSTVSLSINLNVMNTGRLKTKLDSGEISKSLHGLKNLLLGLNLIFYWSW
jgi:hypothetical protein